MDFPYLWSYKFPFFMPVPQLILSTDDHTLSYFKWLCTTIIFSYLVLKYLTFLIFCCCCLVLSFPWLYHKGISKSSSNWGVYISQFLEQNFLITGVVLVFCIVEFLLTSLFQPSNYFIYSSIVYPNTPLDWQTPSVTLCHQQFLSAHFCFLCQGHY